MTTVGVNLYHHRNKLVEEIKQGNFQTLDMLHHLTSGLKSIYSQMCYESIDIIRQNCGGAGYSVWSGLPQLFLDYSP